MQMKDNCVLVSDGQYGTTIILFFRQSFGQLEYPIAAFYVSLLVNTSNIAIHKS